MSKGLKLSPLRVDMIRRERCRMGEIDSLLDSLDPPEKGGGAPRPLFILLGVLLLVSVIGSGVALHHHGATDLSATTLPVGPDPAQVWTALLNEAPGCDFSRSAVYLRDEETRSMAAFAAARYNCVDLLKGLLARGVPLDEQRFIRDTVYSLEDYAAEFGALDVIRLLNDERKEQERKAALDRQARERQREKERLAALERERASRMLSAEELKLKESIYFDRAKLDCEALKSRLGFNAQNFSLMGCIRSEIERRRAERKELGHRVPK